MSCIKRYLEDWLGRIARDEGYTYDELADRLNKWEAEAAQDGVPVDYKQFEDLAIEHDF